jgi:hypothetical protein
MRPTSFHVVAAQQAGTHTLRAGDAEGFSHLRKQHAEQ